MGGLLLWGLFSPRSTWRSLTGWSVTDSHGNEPGALSYALRRLVCAVGALGLGAVLVAAATSYIANLPGSVPPATAVHKMWGAPDPEVVNRVVTPLPAPPAGLPEMSVLGYQAFKSGPPSYLTRLVTYSLLGKSDVAGYIGRTPDVGLAAIDTASMVVNVRGPVLCIPRSAVVIETDATVQIGIFYGLPDAADGSAVDHKKGCSEHDTLTGSVLIPIPLAKPVGDREVQALNGSKLARVPILTDGGK